MEKQRIKAKVTKTSPEKSSDKKPGKQICHICSEKAKMLSCAICEKASCSIHSMVTGIKSSIRICDVCFREQALAKFSQQILIRDKLVHEINDFTLERDANTQILNKSSGKIKNLQKEFIDKEAYYKQKMIEIELKIEETKQRVKINSDQLPGVKREAMKFQMQGESYVKKQCDISEELSIKRAEMEMLVSERTVLVGQLNEVSEFIRSYVPVRILRRVLCNPCFDQVKHAFFQTFRPLLPIKNEVKPNKTMSTAQNRKSACASCQVF